ncbi:MAG: Asp-tRNA(Asn)/Glu-tRNA(Gln) amidotransferase subunit GatB [Deltaproteobacteria bacterium]|nr:Asp-tRNA(Asn)/Glu-tRNA(Gln) amidotransferase subunit GatB [Deltaproteobacteria bacterium]
MTPPVVYEAVIGLEVHAQLLTRSKIFSGSSTEFGAPPNTHVDPVCLGLPGVLPVLNRAAVDCALRLALATGCTVRRRTRFARKHYFYPDLPKGYQISQYEEPIAEHGAVDFEVGGQARRGRLRRIHLEEDAGKNVHRGTTSLVDFNRAGVPLVEIVSEPDLRSADEAAGFMRTLRQLVRWLGICDGNLEEGSLRCDANVSLRPRGRAEYGVKTELKNINSFKFVRDAVAHEIARQEAVLRDGAAVVAETRLWDADRGRSAAMRSKEEAHDYRYFPEPDLPPLVIDEAWLAAAQGQLPDLPSARCARFVADYGLPPGDAATLTAERDLSDYFEAAACAHGDGRTVAHWVLGEVLRALKRTGAAATAAPVGPLQLAGLCDLVRDGTISGKIAKEVFAHMVTTGRGAGAVVAELGLARLSDPAALEAACRAAVAGNPRQVAQYRAGKTKVLGFFVGEVMKATRGQADPAVVNDILRRLLDAP